MANNVESETFLVEEENVCSHLQLRGSVPVFWEQPGINFGKHKCDLVRKVDGALPAAQKHFSKIAEQYSACHVINLLGSCFIEKCFSFFFVNIRLQLNCGHFGPSMHTASCISFNINLADSLAATMLAETHSFWYCRGVY